MKVARNEAGRHWRVVSYGRSQPRGWLSCCLRTTLSLIVLVSLTCPNAALADNNFVDTYNRGITQYNSGDFQGALDSFTEARDLNPKDIRTRQMLIKIHKGLHRFNDAESEYLAIIAMQDTIQNQLDLAELYISMGKPANASTIYQLVLSKEDKNAQALLGSGIAEESLGNLDTAIDFYKQVIDLYPRSTQGENAKNRLGRLTKAQTSESENKFFPIDPTYGEAGLGWWNLKKMPLHVYIDNGDGISGFRSEMRDTVIKALGLWVGASNDNITFIVDGTDSSSESAWKEMDDAKPILKRMLENVTNVPADPIPAQIHVHWTANLVGALGITWTSKLRDGNSILSKAHIWLSTNKLADGTPMPTRSSPAFEGMFDEQIRMLEEVATHEMGHVLGLPHLSNPNDVMAAGVYGFNARDIQEPRPLSPRDVQALAEHYNYFQGTGYQTASRTNLMDEQSKSDSDTTSKEDKEEKEESSGVTKNSNPLGGLKGDDSPDKEEAKEPSDEKKAAEEKKSDEEKAAEEDKSKAGAEKEGSEKAEDKKESEEKKEADAKEAEEKKEAEKAKEEAKAEEKEKEEAAAREAAEKKAEEAEQEEAAASTHHKPIGGPAGYHPLKEAIFLLNTKKYHDSLNTLNKYIKGHHNDVQAFYLRAVVNVMLRDYPLAAADYKEVIKLAPGTDVAKKAADGLKKIRF